MNEHDQQVSGVEATANPAPSTGRRRLVKGAMLATPAVMTLMSGRLAAAASSCAARVGLPAQTILPLGLPQTTIVSNIDETTTTTVTTPKKAEVGNDGKIIVDVEITVTVKDKDGNILSKTTTTNQLILDYESAVTSGLIEGQEGVGNSCLASMA